MCKTYKVYKHTCPNGKSYIGITGQNEKLRWNYGNGYTTQLFGRAIKKYGWENIKHEILEECQSLEDANETEVKYIALYETTKRDKGYNCTNGGDGTSGHIVTDETREKISVTAKRTWADPKMREHLIEHLKELGAKSRGKSLSAETARKIGLANGKAVDQYTLDGEFVATHITMMDAARSIGKKNNNDIVRCCKGKAATAHGYLWRYHGDQLNKSDVDKRIENWIEGSKERFRECAKNNCIPIQQENDCGEVIATFSSAVEASKATGIDQNGIRLCCRGKLKHAGGYVWRDINPKLCPKV